MRVIFFIIVVLSSILLFATGCAKLQGDEKACTDEAKMCPDGSYVGRSGPNCEFAACPDAGKCNYQDESINWVNKDPEACKLVKFMCVPGTEPFFNECGCGCETTDGKKAPVYCTDEERNVNECTDIGRVVCAWFDPAKVQCIDYPCANTVGNPCSACQDDKVLYWTEGECPPSGPPIPY